MDLPFYLGLDIGSVSVKCVLADQSAQLVYDVYSKTKGRPINELINILETCRKNFPDIRIDNIVATGSGKSLAQEILNAQTENEIICHAMGTKRLHPEVRTIIEIGGQDSKLILLEHNEEDPYRATIKDFAMNELCAAGTGAFLDEQACRLGICIEDFAAMALEAGAPAHIAGRCAVFAKTDMIHLQQKGTPMPDILLGVAYSLARNYLSNLVRGRTLDPVISFQGGTASNLALKKAFGDLLHFNNANLIVPEHFNTMGAYGAALLAHEKGPSTNVWTLAGIIQHLKKGQDMRYTDHEDSFYPALSRRADERFITSHRDFNGITSGEGGVFVGIDIGSVSEKIVVIDPQGEILYSDYRYSHGKVLERLMELFREFHERGFAGNVLGMGVTGSGRYLGAKVLGADVVKNEISAQVRGTRHIVPDCDTIIEIGGQDAKFITLSRGNRLDFQMNRLCAAGTGSFLQEQALRLNIDLEHDFSELALRSIFPVRLGNKCTVFMESDLVHYIQKGYAIEDLLAGLSYAVAGNFLDRVSQHKPFGKLISFQGGVAANHAVRSAFENLLEKPVYVSDRHKVIGALGVALLAREAYERGDYSDSGYRPRVLEDVREVSAFQCVGCANHCYIRQLSVGGSKVFFGGVCGKYERDFHGKTMKTMKPDKLQPKLSPAELLEEIDALFHATPAASADGPLKSIGFPRGLLFYEYYPLWNSFFRRAGFNVVTSRRTTRQLLEQGMSHVTVETCLPVKVYYGHVSDLIEKGIDSIFVPGHVNIPVWEPGGPEVEHCPYIQSVPEFITAAFGTKVITQTLSNGYDIDGYETKLTSLAYKLQQDKSFLDSALKPFIEGPRLKECYRSAVEDFKRHREARFRLGQKFLDDRSAEDTVFVVFGKPYTVYDPELNMSLFQKLQALGMEAVPSDLIRPLSEEMHEPYPEIPWYYNRRMLQGALTVNKDPRLFPIILTNYGCGPDPASFRYLEMALSDKPLLVIEIDEHTADAGVLTRLEAFNDEVMSFRRGCEVNSAGRGTVPGRPVIRYEKVYIPHFSEHAYIIASVLKANGTEAVVLPPPGDSIREIGKQHAVSGECQPFINLMGDYIALLNSRSFEQNAAFFMFMNGDCKLKLYGQNTVYSGSRYRSEELPVIGTFDQLFGENIPLIQQVRIVDDLYIGMAALDRILQKLHESRPYEVEKGASDIAYKIARNHICKGIEGGEIISGVEYALSVFDGIDLDKSVPKKFVVVTGDYYTRLNSFANNDLYRNIERLDGIIFVPRFMVDVIPLVMVSRIKKYKKQAEYLKLVQHLLINLELKHQEQKVRHIFENDILNNFDISPDEIYEKTAKYLSNDLSTAIISPVGCVIEAVEKGARGIINVITQNCSYGNVLTSILQRLRSDYGNIPLLTLIYEEQQGGNKLTRLEAFMHQIPKQLKCVRFPEKIEGK
jgi:predicted CoA-substrate-specific enzyme activase